MAKSVFAKFDEDTFTSHFGSRYPRGSFAGERNTTLFWYFLYIGEITRRLNACKANQGTHLSQPLDQHYLFEHMLVASRWWNSSHLEITGGRGNGGIAQHLPFRRFQAGWGIHNTYLGHIFPHLNLLPNF